MDVSNFNIPGFENISVKDAIARESINNINNTLNTYSNNFSMALNNGENIAIIGDSIGAGYGWWTTSSTTSNDGIAAVYREKYSNANIDNYSVSGCTIANLSGVANLSTQVAQMNSEKNYKYIIIMCGINDITYINSHNSADTLGNYYNFYENLPTNDWNTTLAALSSTLYNLQLKFNNATIFFCAEPTCEPNYALYEYIQGQFARICKFYGVGIIDTYSVFPEYKNTATRSLFHDSVHPNESGYRKLATIVENCANFNAGNALKNLTYAPMTFVNFSLTNITNSTTFYERYKLLESLCLTLNSEYRFLYNNTKIVLNDGGDNFYFADVMKDFGGVNRFTIHSSTANDFPVGFKVTQDSNLILYENHEFISTADSLTDLGINSLKDIPASGSYLAKNEGTIATELPTSFTADLLHVNAYVVFAGHSFYKRIEVTSIDDMKIALLIYYYNETAAIDNVKKFTITGT